MKPTTYFLACCAFNVVVMVTLGALGLPFWVFLASLPLVMYTQTYISNLYTARPTLTLEPIPESGYERNIDALDDFRLNACHLGFHKTDEFFLPMSLTTVAFVQHHEHEPVFLASYHNGIRLLYEMVTYLGNGLSLTTCGSLLGGTIARPPQKLLQIFVDRPCDELFEMHLRGIEFLKRHGHHPTVAPPSSFRERYMESHTEVCRILRRPLFMLKFYYWTITKRARIYCKPVQEQYLAKTITLS